MNRRDFLKSATVTPALAALPLDQRWVSAFLDGLREEGRPIVDDVGTEDVLSVMRRLFGEHFDGESWDAWRSFLAALFGLPMSDTEAEIYRSCTGRQNLPTKPMKEAWMIVGRRGGKSRVAALMAVFLACFRSYTIAAGERGVVMIIAADRKQAQVVLRYVKGLLASVPSLDAMRLSDRKEGVDLTNNITIEVNTASFRTVRGYTVVAAILDEIAFWPTDDAANPDTEILKALRPAMATVPTAILLALSSPYARRGELWNAYAKHFGHEHEKTLVWQADTRTMNPNIPQAELDAAYEDDPSSASAEYGAQFRRDIESFIDVELLGRLTVTGRKSLPFQQGTRYVAFADPAGGSGGDSFTLAIAHADSSGRAVLDVLKEKRSPFSPEDVVSEFSEVTKAYGLQTVTSDRYAGDWPVEQWRKRGITCKPSERSKSEIYVDTLPILNSGKVELLDDDRLIKQFTNLERRTSRGGKDSIDHAPGGHDDCCNAAAGAIVGCILTGQQITTRKFIG